MGINRIMKPAAALAMLASVGAAWAQFKVEIARTMAGQNLAVRFSGGDARTAELWVNGRNLVTRTVFAASGAGEMNFSIDPARLNDGDNAVEVRIFDARGDMLGRARTTLAVDRKPNGPVYLVSPKNGSTVTGPVEISLGMRREFARPYVSFFLNGDFTALKNFPPYQYLWDTTQAENGWHEIEAWLVDESNATYKTPAVRVFVNNPGGRTERRLQIREVPVPPVGSVMAPGLPASGAPSQLRLNPDTSATVAGAVRSGQIPALATRAAVELVASMPRPRASALAPSGVKAPDLPDPIVTGARNLTPTGRRTADAPLAGTEAPVTTLKAPTIGNATTVAGGDHSPRLPRIAAAGAEAARRLPALVIGVGARVAEDGEYRIALSDRDVAFDVAPRVENGIPLAPFRHLFEAHGGAVEWRPGDQAVIATREGETIRLRIGDHEAVVNDARIRMELAPFLEKGRTILPLSFFSQALKLDIEFDPNTRHVLIRKR
jgi:hypothetical protein